MGKKVIFKGRAVRLTDHFSTESRRKLNHIISEHINVILCTVSVSFKNERKGMSVSQTLNLKMQQKRIPYSNRWSRVVTQRISPENKEGIFAEGRYKQASASLQGCAARVGAKAS